MKILASSLVAAFLLAACTSDSAQRTAYGTLQNVGQQDCRRNPYLDCPPRTGYDDYERQRQELKDR